VGTGAEPHLDPVLEVLDQPIPYTSLLLQLLPIGSRLAPPPPVVYEYTPLVSLSLQCWMMIS